MIFDRVRGRRRLRKNERNVEWGLSGVQFFSSLSGMVKVYGSCPLMHDFVFCGFSYPQSTTVGQQMILLLKYYLV